MKRTTHHRRAAVLAVAEADRVTCGEGHDRADLDPVDVIADATAETPNGSCETVVRRAPNPSDSRGEDEQEAPKDERVAE